MKSNWKKINWRISFVCVLLLGIACQSPKHENHKEQLRSYHTLDSTSVSFVLPYAKESQILFKPTQDTLSLWFDIIYPSYKARIYCTYLTLDGNLREVDDDVRRFVYRHTVVATHIAEEALANPSHRAFGMLFDIEGPVASPLQFMVTDSVTHVIRGSLYFDDQTADQVSKETLSTIRKDIKYLIQSIKWK